jgi:hypothetical protein
MRVAQLVNRKSALATRVTKPTIMFLSTKLHTQQLLQCALVVSA